MAIIQQFLIDISGKFFINITGQFGLDSTPFRGSCLTLDSNGRIYFPASYKEDTSYPWKPTNMWLGQYSEQGNLNWQKSIGGSNAQGGSNSPFEVSTDSAISPDEQYVYFCGTYNSGASSYIRDVIIVKYKENGTLEWKKTYGNSDDQYGNAIKIDSSGNFYICGRWDNGSTYRGFLTKFNSSATIQWQKQIGGRTDYEAMDMDSSGNIYIAGSVDSGPADCLVVKYNSSGTVQWQKRITRGSSNYYEGTNAIAVDSSSNVYITGFSNHSSSTDDQPFLMKLNSSGTFQWARKIGNYDDDDRVNSVACDSDDNVYVTGYDANSNSNRRDALVVKFNSSGTVQWKRVLGVSGAYQRGYSINIDSRNNIVLGGDTYLDNDGGFGSRDYWLSRFPSDGSKTGTYTLEGKSWVYQSTSINVANSTGWSVTNAGQSTGTVNYSVGNSSLSDGNYTSSSTTISI